MKRLVLALLAVALVAVLVPTTAVAKGASEATITGPGIDPITLAGEGQAGGEQLMQLAEDAGFFPSVFVTTPDPMLDRRPAGSLGPKYTITYVMPGPDAEPSELTQDLYPFASPSPVSYMKPGQTYFGTERTRGGWFVSTSTLKSRLVAAGLPATRPTGGRSDVPWALLAALTAVAASAAAVLWAGLRTRRRPGAAPA